MDPYRNARQVVTVLEDSDFYTMRDLDDKTIGVKITTQPEKIFLTQEKEELSEFSRVYSLSNVDEVAIALRNHYVDAVSGYLATLIHLFGQNHVQNSLNAGMNGHVAKPVDVNKLVNTLSVFVNGFN